MSREPILGAVSLLVLLSARPIFSQEGPSGLDSIHQTLVDAIFLSVDTPESPGCAVSVMREGQIVYERGYGSANLEYDIAITPTSIFHVASVSKQFTAMAVSLLAAEGKLSWDDDVRVHVPEVPDFGVPITLRHLANHTSGLRDQWELLSMAGWRWEADVVRQEDVLDITARQKALNFMPGEEYLYSNTGYTLLAVVVERVTGKTLREFANERIFRPLGMGDTHFHDDHQMIVRNRAYAYAADAEQGLKISIPDFAIVGASSLFTTARDLARWDRNFYSGEVGGPAVLQELQTRGVLSNGDSIDYALGLSHGRYRGVRTVGHGGADAGYRSNFVRFPDQKFSVAVLCNYPSSAPERKSQEIADIYLADALAKTTDKEERTPARAKLSEAQLRRYEGFYVATYTDIPLHVRERVGRLFMGRFDVEELIPLGEGRFREKGGDRVVRFERGESSGVMRVSVPEGSSRRYRRAEPPDTSEAALAEYAGDYYSAELGAAYSIRRNGHGLALWNRKHGLIPLRPTHRDGFSSELYSLTFSRDGQGRVDGFTVSSPRVRKVGFQRTS